MAGLIGSNVGQAISSFGANIGNLMFKSIGDEADRDARIAAKKEEWQARLQDRQDARQENSDLRRELLETRLDFEATKASTKAAGGSTTGGKSGGINMEDIKPGGSQEVWAAAKLDMTVPQYKEFYNSLKTGDKSAFLQEVTRTNVAPVVKELGDPTGDMSDAVSRSTAIRTPETIKAPPPGFEAEYSAKMKKLADLQESYALGGQYDDVMKGRQTKFQTGVGEGVLAGNIKPGAGSEAVGASLAKERFKVEGGEKLNVFQGDSTTTPKGLSEIQENVAQANKPPGSGKGGSTGAKAVRVQSTKEDSDGNMILVMTDGSTKPMLGTDGKPVRSASFNKEVARIIAKLEEDDSAFKKLPPDEKRKRAEQRLTGRTTDAAPAADVNLKGKVEASGQKYEPSKYDYRIGPDGSVQRKLK